MMLFSRSLVLNMMLVLSICCSGKVKSAQNRDVYNSQSKATLAANNDTHEHEDDKEAHSLSTDAIIAVLGNIIDECDNSATESTEKCRTCGPPDKWANLYLLNNEHDPNKSYQLAVNENVVKAEFGVDLVSVPPAEFNQLLLKEEAFYISLSWKEENAPLTNVKPEVVALICEVRVGHYRAVPFHWLLYCAYEVRFHRVGEKPTYHWPIQSLQYMGVTE